MTVNKERVELWVEALESDRYHKCVNSLRRPNRRGSWKDDNPYLYLYCALGVGIEVAHVNGCENTGYDFEQSAFPGHVREWYGFNITDPLVHDECCSEYSSVISMNDNHNDHEHSFWDIAQALRTEFLKDKGNG